MSELESKEVLADFADFDIKHNEIVMITGRKKKGKSVMFRHIVEKFLSQGRRVILFDAEHEYRDFKHPMLEVYQPERPKDINELEWVCEQVWNAGSCILAIESIDMYTSPKKDLPLNLSQIVHWGRKQEADEAKGIGLILTTRRLAGCNKDAPALANYWIVFKTTLSNDISYLKDNIGDIAEQAPDLKKWHFILWDEEREIKKTCNPIKLED